MSRRSTSRTVPGVVRHGTAATYDWWGCRCDDCTEAHRLYRKRLREGRQPAAKISSLGTSRRVQGLVALGYSLRDLGARLGVSARRVAELARAEHPFVLRETAASVEALFEELAATPGNSRYALTVARRYGWLPPLAWDDIDSQTGLPADGDVSTDFVDEVAVERVLAGERIDLSDAELLAAAQIGAARGMTPWALSEVLRMNVFGARKLMAGELPPRRARRAARVAGAAS